MEFEGAGGVGEGVRKHFRQFLHLKDISSSQWVSMCHDFYFVFVLFEVGDIKCNA